jgi:hypothetical protein
MAQPSTSNTFNNIVVDTRTFIDRCYGALKLRPQQISGEMQQIAIDMINLVQQDLLNDNAPLWTHKSAYVPLVQGQRSYKLPVATHDVVLAFLRTMNNVTTQSTATVTATSYLMTFTSPAYVTNVQLTFPASGVFPFIIQSSPDNINWTTCYTSNIDDTGVTGDDTNQNGTINIWVSTSNSNAQLYWQIIPATTNPVTGTTFVPANVMTSVTAQVYNVPNDILMYRMNKDDYWNMTNKNFQGRPLQYWLNRQISPTMELWPQPDSYSAQQVMLVRRQRYLMDVGSLGSLQNALLGTLEFPGRWYLPMIYMVAAELAYCTPEVDPQVTALIGPKSEKMRQRAFLEERDKSPIKFQTNIGIYTK